MDKRIMLSDRPKISQRLGYGVSIKNVGIVASVILPCGSGQMKLENPR